MFFVFNVNEEISTQIYYAIAAAIGIVLFVILLFTILEAINGVYLKFKRNRKEKLCSIPRICKNCRFTPKDSPDGFIPCRLFGNNVASNNICQNFILRNR